LETLPERQLAALKELLGAQRIRSKRIVAALPTSLVVTRTCQIDRAKPIPVDDQIRGTLQNCLPFDSKDLMFDYWPTTAGTMGARSEEILVVATQASLVQKYLDGFEKLHLTCVHIDVAPCALATLLQKSVENPSAVVGTIALSVGVGFFAIVENGRVLFWRPFDLSASPAGQKGVMISGLQTNLDRVGDEISKCVSHMVGSMNVDTLSELVVYGMGSDDVVVTEYLKNRFHLPVRSPSPFEAMGPEALSAGMRETVDHKTITQYHAAVGLALQCAGAPVYGANVNG
jgi:Tfp pilus assembly PilM family ATPase